MAKTITKSKVFEFFSNNKSDSCKWRRCFCGDEEWFMLKLPYGKFELR